MMKMKKPRNCFLLKVSCQRLLLSCQRRLASRIKRWMPACAGMTIPNAGMTTSNNGMTNFMFLLVLSFTLFLSGCGFHLRGAPPLPPNLHRLGVQSNAPYGALTQNLTQVLKSIGLIISPANEHPPLSLVIDSESFSSTSYTQSSSSSTEQYIMYYTVTYHLINSKSESIWGPKVIKQSQIYSLNQNQVLSTDTVQQSVELQLQQDAVYQIIAQLGSSDAQAAIASLDIPTKTVQKS
ncbi:MAG: hypothetical protein HKM04_05010 [Legionellales bacterium]|nr:hypothetical protein [Legionellales bacterium]